MAQRTIHYLFGQLIARELALKDRNRFLLGSVLPDAYADRGERDKTHFVRRDGAWRFFDFWAFKERYLPLMRRDDLYLGYYMHLVEDNFYRQFVFVGHGISRAVESPEGVKRLHNDYHLLNAHIVKRYGLSYDLRLPADFAKEPIHDIAGFAAEAFLREMREDFVENPAGSTYYVSEAMLDEFTATYVPVAIEELRHVLHGETYLDPRDYMWARA